MKMLRMVIGRERAGVCFFPGTAFAALVITTLTDTHVVVTVTRNHSSLYMC